MVLSAFPSCSLLDFLVKSASRYPRPLRRDKKKTRWKKIRWWWKRVKLGSAYIGYMYIWGFWWVALRNADGTKWCHCNYLWMVTITGRDSWWMEQRKYLPEGKSEGLPDSQPHLTAWEGVGKHCPENLVISGHMKDKNAIRSIQHGFMKGQQCFTDLIAICNKMKRAGPHGLSFNLYNSAALWFASLLK